MRDFKARLSEYLRQVSKGHTVIITDHGHPVGRLSPVQQTLDERIKSLQDAGMVAWNGRKPGAAMPATVNRSDRQVSDLLVEMRE